MSEIQLHERSKDEIFNIAVQLRTDNFIKEKKIEELENPLQQKENIIKEVREYIPKLRRSTSYDLDEKLDELLEILDKGE